MLALRLAMLLSISALFSGACTSTSNGKSRQVQTAAADSLFSRWKGSNSPGCLALVIADGVTAYAAAHGMADIEQGVPLDENSVFNVGSIAKQFTATAVALLAHSGRLSLDEDIRTYLPEIGDFEQRITIRDLIHHTGGIRDYYFLFRLHDPRLQHVADNDDVLALLARQQGLNSEPGREFLYSNSGYILLAAIIERVTDAPFSQYVSDAIFGPLGMNNTRFVDDPTTLIARRVQGYRYASNGVLVRSDISHGRVGDAGLWTTVGDLARWVRHFEAPAIGDASLIERLTTPTTLLDGSSTGYGFGLHIDDGAGGRRIWHGGETAGYRGSLMWFPASRLGVGVFCNVANADASDLAMRLAAIWGVEPAGQRVSNTLAAPPTNREIVHLVGTYYDAQREIVRKLSFRDGQLWFGPPNGSARPLIDLGSDLFELQGSRNATTLRFVTERPGGPQFELSTAGEPPAFFHRVPDMDERPLSNFIGTYVSGELDACWEIVAFEQELRLRRAQFPDVTLEPLFLNAFRAEGVGLVSFTRDDEEFSGFQVSTPRARRVAFMRDRCRSLCQHPSHASSD